MEGGREGGHYSEQLERVLRVRGVTLLGLLYAPAGVHAEWGERTKQGERVMVTSTEMHFIHSDFFSVVAAAAAVVEPFARAGAGAAAATRKIIYINIRAVNCVLWHVK